MNEEQVGLGFESPLRTCVMVLFNSNLVGAAADENLLTLEISCCRQESLQSNEVYVIKQEDTMKPRL